jgi:lipoic acid synthetase
MNAIEKKRRLPEWIRVRIGHGGSRKEIQNILSEGGLNTVCASAHCPNLGECWHKRTAAFMILGDLCARNCAFCAVKHSDKPLPPPSIEEPLKVASAVVKMGLRHAVITSVTRDDLPNGGAEFFAAVIEEIRLLSPKTKIEVLTPDFLGKIDSLSTVIDAGPDIFNHNLETVERLTPLIRSSANYERSLNVLSSVKKISKKNIVVKSGIMLGLGEEEKEIEETLRDLRGAGVEMLTIGQYICPSKKNIPEARFAHPDEFEDWKKKSLELGFKKVASGPLVRSSYMAEEQFCR